MGLLRFLRLTLTFSVFWCFSLSFAWKDPFHSCLREYFARSRRAYPTFFGIIEEGLMLSSGWSGLCSEEFRELGVPESSPRVVDVDDYGAKADGRDDTKAFEQAWKVACSSAPAVLLVPAHKKYLVKQIIFAGPCKSSVIVKITGTIEAPSSLLDWDEHNRRHWILFQNIADLKVEGGKTGTIKGNGNHWWENSCKKNKSLPCKLAPTAITFYSCTDLMVKNLKIVDGQQIQLSFERCNNVHSSNILISAPEKSPNTDGIHITSTRNILIMESVIQTGDDCISIVNGSKNVKATRITCGPGHGISIGSLGKGGSEDHVSQVLVDTAHLVGTTNGVRIKTWQGGSGDVKNIVFKNIVMNNVSNPIIIDQNYCDANKPCKKQDSAVQVSNVVYGNIRGTSASEIAVSFNCSKKFPCRGILLRDINLFRTGGKNTQSKCINVMGKTDGHVYPTSCFQWQ